MRNSLEIEAQEAARRFPEHARTIRTLLDANEAMLELLEERKREDYRRELTYVPDYEPMDPSDPDYFREF